MRHLSRLHAASFSGALFALWFVSVAGAQNLLSNGNLDSVAVSTQTLATPTGWTAAASIASTPFADAMSSEDFGGGANVLDPGGKGLFFKPFQGSAANGGPITASLSQTHTAFAGQTFTMTGWAGAGTGYIGLTDPTVKSEFHLIFLNSSSVVLADNTLNLVTAGLGVGSPTSPATAFAYHPFSITATAPANTHTVEVEALMGNAYPNPAGGDQAFLVDAFSLTVPEPASLSMLALGALGLVSRRRR